MNGSLCSAVAGTTDGASILEALEREQFLLVPLDEHGHWYRYHHLLREFLVDRLRTKMADQIQDLHRRAYRWYAAREMWSEAVHYAIAAGDFPLAIEFIENCAMSMVVKGDLLTLLSWEQQLPKELMSSQLEVKLALAWGMSLVTRFKEADVLLNAGRGRRAGDARQRSVVEVPRRAGGLLCPHRRQRPRQGHRPGMPRRPPVRRLQLQRAVQRRPLCLPQGRATGMPSTPSRSPDASAGEASYVLPENYRLCLYGLAAVKQLKFEEALEFYAARASAGREVRRRQVGLGIDADRPHRAPAIRARRRHRRGSARARCAGPHRDDGVPRGLPQRLLRARPRRRHPRRSRPRREPAQSRRTAELGARMGRRHRHAAGRAHAHCSSPTATSSEAIALLPAFEELHAKHPAGIVMLEHAHPHLEHGGQGPDRCRLGQSGGRCEFA